MSVHETEDPKNPDLLLVMKGAPERVWDRCATVLINDEDVAIDAHQKIMFEQAYLELGGLGERVLGFCDFTVRCLYG